VRFLSLLETSARLEDILELERELADVRYEIESYTTYLNDLDNKVKYSTVYLDIREVFEINEIEEVPVTFSERISSGFTKSLNGVIDGFGDFIVWFVGNLPALVIWLRKRKHTYTKELTKNESTTSSDEHTEVDKK
jgi:hypothetical protein